jgi:hypothetical protein
MWAVESVPFTILAGGKASGRLVYHESPGCLSDLGFAAILDAKGTFNPVPHHLIFELISLICHDIFVWSDPTANG